MAAYLAAWLVLSVAAAITVFTLRSPSDAAADRRPAAGAGHEESSSAPASARVVPGVKPGGLTVEGSGGWRVRTFYAVHQTFYYYAKDTRVRGCLQQDCRGGEINFGRFEREFVEAVRSQGTGLICYGKYTNKWLNWNARDGYYLSDEPRAFGSSRQLVPFKTVFSSSPLLPANTRLRVLACEKGSGDGANRVCDRLRNRSLRIADLANNGISRTIWVYAGKQEREELRPAVLGSTTLRIG